MAGFIRLARVRLDVRLGGPVTTDFTTPAEWIEALRERGYSAATAPVDPDAEDAEIRAYREAAERADIHVAEVGAWENNPISDDVDERQAAIENCARHLELAETLDARCCVNVAGSRGSIWDGPHPANFEAETFDRVVESVRAIIDRVEPDRTTYTLEPMPWIVPHSIESQRAILEAVDRDAFGVHFDPVNVLTSPERWANNADYVCRFVDEFGPHIEAVHLKDAVLRDDLTVHVDEVRPGAGDLDYRALLGALDELDDDLALLFEHLEGEAAYEKSATYVREVADEIGVDLAG